MNPIYRHSFADALYNTGIINSNTGVPITTGEAVQNRYYTTNYIPVSNIYPAYCTKVQRLSVGHSMIVIKSLSVVL